MPNSFTISTPATELKTDAKGHTEAVFTVTNTTTRPVRGMARPKALQNAKAEWLQVTGPTELDFPPGGTQQITVSFDGQVPVAPAAPSPAPAEQYGFRLDVASAMNPDEDFTEGPPVKVQFPAAEKPKETAKGGFPKWVLIPIIAVVLIGIGVGIFLAVRKKTVVVPNVVGMTLDEANSTLSSGNLVAVEKEVQITGKAPTGQIISQEPAADTEVDKNSEVMLITEGEEPKVDVPDVTRRLVSDAKAQLTAKGLSVVEKSTEVSEGLEVNQVVSQNPVGGDKVKPGSTVELVVAVQRQINVPDVVFKPANIAQQQITAAGLKFVMKDPELGPANVAPGNIKSQNPAANTKVPPNAVIELVAAAQSTAVPPVVGRKIAEAQILFQQAGLDLGRVTGTVNASNASTVTITGQTPAGNTTVARGSRVDVAVPVICSRFQRCFPILIERRELQKFNPNLRFVK